MAKPYFLNKLVRHNTRISDHEYGGLREGAKLRLEGLPLTASAIGCLRFWPKGVLVRPCMGDKKTKIMGHGTSLMGMENHIFL